MVDVDELRSVVAEYYNRLEDTSLTIQEKNKLLLQEMAKLAKLPEDLPSHFPSYLDLNRRLLAEEVLDDLENRAVYANAHFR